MRILTVSSSNDIPILENAEKEVNAFNKFIQSLDWDNYLALAISKGIQLVILIILFFLLKKIGKKIISRSFHNYEKKDNYSENRIRTLHTLANNTYQYTLFFLFSYSILALLGVPVASLLAGAGVAGVAIGLGAQGFINDLITGFFIILERQLEVGDYVQIEAIEGNVLAVGLRTTQLKSLDGTIHFIPNHTIQIISNRSRSNMRVIINLRVEPEADIPKITSILKEVNEKLVSSYKVIKSGPDILGLVDLGGGNFAIQVLFYTSNGSQAEVQRDFLAAYIEALTKEGVSIPRSPIQLTNA